MGSIPRWLIIWIFSLSIIFFVANQTAYPGINFDDEFNILHDGYLIRDYVLAIASGDLHHPLTFMYEYQKTTIGIFLNIYPPSISILYAIVMLYTDNIIVVRLVHLAIAIACLLLFFVVLRKQYSERIAAIATIFASLTFAFMKYGAVLQREVGYFFCILLAMHFLQRYFEKKNPRDIVWFFLSLALGSMVKDFFNFALPAFGLYFLLCAGKQFRKSVAPLLRWDVILAALAYVGVTLTYYSLKLLSSAASSSMLLGSFNPLAGIVGYARLQVPDVPVLIVLFLIALIVVVPRHRLATPVGRYNAIWLCLLFTFALIIISIREQHLRYAFIFAPIAAIFAAQVIDLLWERSVRIGKIAFGIVAVSLLISSVFSAIAYEQFSKEFDARNDPAAVDYLVENSITGNILLLSDYRFDVSFYLRNRGHNLENELIIAYFEKTNAQQISWSRFKQFSSTHPQCTGEYSVACWEAFVAERNITIIMVEKDPLSQQDMAGYAATLGNPTHETRTLKIYLLTTYEK